MKDEFWERFTQPGRQVRQLAEDEARQLKHGRLGTSHILLGLTRERRSRAAKVLEGFDITDGRVRYGIVSLIGSGDETDIERMPFTPRSKKVFEQAPIVALELGHRSVGTEHILLSLLRSRGSVAVRILGQLGADVELIGEEMLNQIRVIG